LRTNGNLSSSEQHDEARTTYSMGQEEEKIREIERTWAMRERKSKGNNELVAQVMELTGN